MICFQLFCTIFVLLCCVCVSTVSAFNCYQCNSHLEPECADLKAHPPHKVAGFHRPCDAFDEEGNPAFCRIISYKFKFLSKSDPDANRVIRTCAYKRSPKECYAVDNDHHLETVCQCFGDGCNSAANVSIFSFISTVVLAAMLYIFS